MLFRSSGNYGQQDTVMAFLISAFDFYAECVRHYFEISDSNLSFYLTIDLIYRLGPAPETNEKLFSRYYFCYCNLFVDVDFIWLFHW